MGAGGGGGRQGGQVGNRGWGIRGGRGVGGRGVGRKALAGKRWRARCWRESVGAGRHLAECVRELLLQLEEVLARAEIRVRLAHGKELADPEHEPVLRTRLVGG